MFQIWTNKLGSLFPANCSAIPGLVRATCCLVFVAVIFFNFIAIPPLIGQEVVSPESTAFVPKRWGVVCSEEMNERGFGDLLTESLSKQEFELVERQSIDAIRHELELTTLATAENAKARLQLGKQLSADVLVLVSLERLEKHETLRLVICDCQFGSRLLLWQTKQGDNGIEKLVELCTNQVMATRERFSSGISRIIGVAPIRSENLTHEFDRYQKSFQYLIQSGLTTYPGVAVIEIDEARAIQQELARTDNDKLNRDVLTLLGGIFRVEKDVDGGVPEITIELQLQNQDGDSKLNTPPMSFEVTSSYLSEELPHSVIGAERRHDQVKELAQFDWLASGADSFAIRGDWTGSIAMREAALLLQPDDVGQHRALIHEILRFCRAPVPNQSRLMRLAPDHPDVKSVARIMFDEYLSYLGHLEYLIRNRMISADEAVSLTRTAGDMFMNQQSGYLLVRDKELAGLLSSEESKFFDRISARVMDLPRDFDFEVVNPQLMNFHELTEECQLQVAWYELYFLSMRFRVDGNTQSVTDLKRIEDFLLKSYPDGLPIGEQTFGFFGHIPQLEKRGPLFFRQYPNAATPEEVRAFLQRLVESDHSTTSFLAKYALFENEVDKRRLLQPLPGQSFGRPGPEQVTNDEREQYRKQLAIAEQLVLEFEQLPYSIEKPLSERKEEVVWQLISLTRDLLANTIESSDAVHMEPEVFPGILQIDHRGAAGTVRTKELNFGFRSEEVQKSVDQIFNIQASENNNHVPWHNELNLQKCGDNDVWFNRRVVLIMREKGILEKVEPQKRVSEYTDVCWDGENIWVASLKNGVQILDPESLSFKHTCGTGQGLPSFDMALRIAAMEPGKIVASGSFGKSSRAWCATISLEEDHLIPNVFLEVTKVPVESHEDSVIDDPSFVFEPVWITRYPSTDPNSSRFLIGRGRNGHADQRTPLLIDCRDGSARSFGTRLSSSGYHPEVYCFYEGKAVFTAHPTSVWVQKDITNESDIDGDRQRDSRGEILCKASEGVRHSGNYFGKQLKSGFLFKRGDRLIVPGQQFFVLDPETLEQQRYVSEKPDEILDIQSFFGDSAHYGMIGWDGYQDGKFQVVQFTLHEGGIAPKPDSEFDDVETAIAGALDRIDGISGNVTFEIQSASQDKFNWFLHSDASDQESAYLTVKINRVVAEELLEGTSIRNPDQMIGKTIEVSGTAIRERVYIDSIDEQALVNELLASGQKLYRTAMGKQFYYYETRIEVESSEHIRIIE